MEQSVAPECLQQVKSSSGMMDRETGITVRAAVSSLASLPTRTWFTQRSERQFHNISRSYKRVRTTQKSEVIVEDAV